jgi:hypothetical protein
MNPIYNEHNINWLFWKLKKNQWENMCFLLPNTKPRIFDNQNQKNSNNIVGWNSLFLSEPYKSIGWMQMQWDNPQAVR